MARRLVSRGREQNERPLSESEERFRTLIENLPLVTYADSAGPDGRTVYISPQIEQLLGYPAEEWLGNPDLLMTVLHPDDHERVRVQRGDRHDRDTNLVFRVISREGRVVTVQSARVAIRDEEGNSLYTLGFWVDISDQVLLEEELRQAQKVEALGRLAGGIAHDFNNVLTAIGGYAELARARLDEPAAVEQALQGIAEATDSGAALTAQLLAFSRREPAQLVRFQLNDAVRSTVRLLERLIGGGVAVTLELDAESPTIEADPAQLGQVVLNLALNARDAMPNGGTLTIATRLAGDEVELVVADSGIGMTEEVRARAFDPFFTTKESGSGTGLGLSIVLEIAAQNGGRVTLESAPGEGTTVTVVVPRAEPE